MRKLFCILLFSCMATATQAQPIPDMSLSPEETMREPDIIHDHTEEYLGGANYNRNGGTEPDYYSMQLAPRKKMFMDEYCDPSIQPIVDSVRFKGLMACVESVKKQACDGFAKLPEDAKEHVDNTAKCVYSAAESGVDTTYDIQCRDAYARQLWLLKKYWDDRTTAYTILFLPDMLVDAGSFCNEES